MIPGKARQQPPSGVKSRGLGKMQIAEVLLLAAVFSCRRLASHGWQQEAALDGRGDVRMYWTADVKKNVLLVEVSHSLPVTHT